MMLAQMPTPTPAALAAWIISAAAVVWGVNQLMKLVDRLKGQPPSGELDVALDALNERVKALEKLETEHEERRRKLYEHIDKVRVELRADIKDMDHKIDQIPNQVIVTLKHTGALRRT